MRCKNCGAVAKDDSLVCSVCGGAISMNHGAIAEDISNPATDDFMSQNSIRNSYQQSLPQEPNPMLENMWQKEDEDKSSKYVEKDGNDRVTATLMNFVTFAVMAIIFVMICVFLYNAVKN